MIRISVYSDNLAIFWKSVQEAFARAGFDILRNYPCPTDAAGGGLLVDDLCHALADETPCYLFIDDFHLLTDKRASLFLCMLANRLPANVHLIVASRDRFLPADVYKRQLQQLPAAVFVKHKDAGRIRLGVQIPGADVYKRQALRTGSPARPHPDSGSL